MYRESTLGSLVSKFARFYLVGLLLWGYQNNYVFREIPTTIVELKNIKQDDRTIDENILNNFYKNIDNRLCFVLRGTGGYLKHLLNQKSLLCLNCTIKQPK